jgi:nitrogen fixation NifU-like protein
MASLDQLYQQVILDHDREKHGYGLRDVPAPARSTESKQYNPLCGDTVTLRVVVEDPPVTEDPAEPSAGVAVVAAPVVRDVSWTGDGCSISQASTSVLHDLVTGRPVPETEQVLAAFREMIRSRGQLEPDEEVLGDGVAFAGVGRHANRVKCAMLGWTAFEDALHRLGVSSPAREEK